MSRGDQGRILMFRHPSASGSMLLPSDDDRAWEYACQLASAFAPERIGTVEFVVIPYGILAATHWPEHV